MMLLGNRTFVRLEVKIILEYRDVREYDIR